MAADLIPLSIATTLALARLAPEREPGRSCANEERNAVAVALSGLISIYTRDAASGELRRMSEDELGAGRFADGAAKFVFADHRPEIHLLVVKEAELDDAIATISASLDGRRYIERSPIRRAHHRA